MTGRTDEKTRRICARSAPLGPTTTLRSAEQSEQRRRRDPGLGCDGPGALATFVAPRNFFDLSSSQARRQAMKSKC